MKIYLAGAGRNLNERIMRGINQQITNALVESGIGAWFDVYFSKEIRTEIRQWIEDSDVLILICCKGGHHNAIFRYHWDIALKIKKRVVIVRVDEASLPSLKLPDHFNILCVASYEEIAYAIVEFFHSTLRYNLFVSYARQDFTTGHLF